MQDAVMLNCGHSGGADSLNELLDMHNGRANCPTCNSPFVRADIKPNYKLREAIERYKKDKESKENREEEERRRLAQIEENARQAAEQAGEQRLRAERQRLEEQARQLEAGRRRVEEEMEVARVRWETETARLQAAEERSRQALAEAQAREEALRRSFEAERERERAERARREAESRQAMERELAEREAAARRAGEAGQVAIRKEREAREAERARAEALEESARQEREADRTRLMAQSERERRRVERQLAEVERARQELREEREEVQRLRRELAEKSKTENSSGTTSEQNAGIAATLWNYLPSVPIWSLWGATVQDGPLVRKLADYRIADRRGARKTSPVWKAMEIATKKEVAVKLFRHQPAASSTPPAGFTVPTEHPLGAWREAMMHQHLEHPNILPLKGVMQGPNKDEFYMILPFIENDLEHVIEAFPEAFNMSQIRHMMFQLLLALSYLHSGLVVHRDLQPANIMMSKTGEGRIWISSLSRARALNNKPLDQLPPSPYICYRAPELLLSSHPRLSDRDWAASDVWSCGCIFAQLFSRRPPFQGTTADEVLTSILSFTDCRLTLHDMPARFSMLNTHIAFSVAAKTSLEELARGRIRPRLGESSTVQPSELSVSPTLINVQRLQSISTSGRTSTKSKGKERLDDDDEERLRRKGSGSTSAAQSAPGSSNQLPAHIKWSQEDEEELRLALELLRQMLCFDPWKRITAAEALGHEYFARHATLDQVRRTKRHLWKCPQETLPNFKDDHLKSFVGEQCAGLTAV